MAYKVERVNDCTRKLVFNFETIDLTKDIQKALLEKQKNANLKGFRKGKAPIAVVQKLFGPQIENDALQSFVRNEFFTAIENEKIKMLGYPHFENMNYEGKSVKFDATVEVFPELKLKDLSKLSFTQDTVFVEDSEVEDMKKRMLDSKSTLEVTAEGTKVKNGHQVVINFQGTMPDGEKPENMKGEEFVLEIGSNQFIPGFEEGLVGAKAKDKKTLELTFPADYHMDTLKNAKVSFDVEILEVKEKKVPAFTDEVAKEFKYDSVADFAAKTKNNLLKQKTRQAEQKLHQEILEKLIAENTFDVPKSLLEQQKGHLRQDLAQNLKQQGFTEDMLKQYYSKWDEDFNAKALFQVKSGLILDHLANVYKITTSESDLDKKLEESASEAGIGLDELKNYYKSNEKIKSNIMYAIREEKTFEALKKEIKVK
jgi:trigger factor